MSTAVQKLEARSTFDSAMAVQNGAVHWMAAQHEVLAHLVGGPQLQTLDSVSLSLTGATWGTRFTVYLNSALHTVKEE